ncbi:MAG: ABC transporter permease [Bacteroidota bacterium]
MSFEWFIAKRYLQAHRRSGFLSFISSFAIAGITLGTAALIITLSVLAGFEREIKEKVIGFTAHIQVFGLQNKPLTGYQRSIEEVKSKLPGIKGISPYVAKEAMIRSKEAVDGVFLKGIDPAVDVTSIRKYLVMGRCVSGESGDMHEIVIGKKLADKLNVALGDKLVVFGLPAGDTQSIQPRAMQFRLVGIYESGMAEYDDIYAYTDLRSAQQIFQLGDKISGYDVLVNDLTSVDENAKQLQELLGYPHYARTVFETYRNLFSWVDLQKKMSPVLMALIVIVAAVNVIGTLLMFVLERTQAIGILKSLGAGPGHIQRIFWMQGMAIAVLGIVAGNIVAFVLCWLQLRFRLLSLPSDIYFMNSVPMMLKAENFVLVSTVVLLLTMVTTILPSRSAAKLDTIAALRFG